MTMGARRMAARLRRGRPAQGLSTVDLVRERSRRVDEVVVHGRVHAAVDAIARVLIGADHHEAAVLQRVPDLSGVFGANLFSAEGASQAVNNAGLAGTVKVAAFDAPEAAIEDLRNNVVDIVIAQSPYEMGQKCIEFAVAASKGDTASIDKRWPTGYTIITRDNVDTPEAQQAIYSSK